MPLKFNFRVGVIGTKREIRRNLLFFVGDTLTDILRDPSKVHPWISIYTLLALTLFTENIFGNGRLANHFKCTIA